MLAHDDVYEHTHLGDVDREEIARILWRQDNVALTTVGIDIGSSTSHLLFARVTLQRQSQALSSRFVVVGREVVWRSPILLTPFVSDGTIDAHALEHFIQDCYRDAAVRRAEVDSGAVILTGEAIKRQNARAIDELFAAEAGKFVCATAGHKLEATLAAHGSGAVQLSRRLGQRLLHVDIGGGTTKLALVDRGRLLGGCAFAVGGRVLAMDAGGRWTRIDDSARLVAEELGLPVEPATFAEPASRRRVARRLAQVTADYLTGARLDRLGMALQLTELLPPDSPPPESVTFSGGVSEYLFGREHRSFGDIAELLADELRVQLKERVRLPVFDPGQGIRATVIGASQFTVQVSGKTIYLPAEVALPVHNVPVVQMDVDLSGAIDSEAVFGAVAAGMSRLGLSPEAPLAVALKWAGDPEYERLAALGRAIQRAVAPEGRRQRLLLLAIDGDVAKTLGSVMQHELGFSGPLAAVDGLQLKELDYLDVGALIDPPGVVPVVIKSLLFS
ncbi:MAG TPA: ethanolamine ammonia-lyase reactivating factor EutA [Myxococcaceae bacterium]|nr:ethanolamine ammonia-lyase reactivating factor EutA [Myxococcaceae bacterium]